MANDVNGFKDDVFYGLQSCVAANVQERAKQRFFVDLRHMTPSRKNVQLEASKALNIQAQKMKAQARSAVSNGTLPIGTIVKLRASEFDRSKTDPTHATVVVVAVGTTNRNLYRVANSAGVLDRMMHRSYLAPIVGATAKLMGLEWILHTWRAQPTCTTRMILTGNSAMRGPGFRKCTCKNGCVRGRCSCLKLGRFCNSRCHPGRSCNNCEV